VVLPSSVQDVRFGKAQGAGRRAQGIEHGEQQQAGGSGQKSEVRDQTSEVRRQTLDDRRQKKKGILLWERLSSRDLNDLTNFLIP